MPRLASLGVRVVVLASVARWTDVWADGSKSQTDAKATSVSVGDCIANPFCDQVAAASRQPDTIVQCACASDRDPSSYQKVCIPAACDSARVCRFMSIIGEDGACRVTSVHRPMDDWEKGLCRLWRPAWLMKLQKRGEGFIATMRSLPKGWIVKRPASECAKPVKERTEAAPERDAPLPLPECKDDAQGRARNGHCCQPGGLTVICGAYDREVVRLAIRRNIGSLVACYESADDSACLQPIIDFTVDASGAVPQAAIRFRAAMKQHPHLRECMVRAVRSWRFPPPPDGASAFVRYPFLPDFGEGCPEE